MFKKTLEWLLAGSLILFSPDVVAQEVKKPAGHACDAEAVNLVSFVGEFVDEQIYDCTKLTMRFDAHSYYYFLKYRDVLDDLSKSCIPSHDKNNVLKRAVLDSADRLIGNGLFLHAQNIYSVVNERVPVNWVMHNLERNLLSSMNNFESTLSFLRNNNIFPKNGVVHAVKNRLNSKDYESVCAMLDYSRDFCGANFGDCADEILPEVNSRIRENFSFVESVYSRFGRDIPADLIQVNAEEILFKHPFAINYIKSKNIIISDDTLVCVVDKFVHDKKFSNAVMISGAVKNPSKSQFISFADSVTAPENFKHVDFDLLLEGVKCYNRAGYHFTKEKLDDILGLIIQKMPASVLSPEALVDTYFSLKLPVDVRSDALVEHIYFVGSKCDIKKLLQTGIQPSNACLVDLGERILLWQYEYDFDSVEKICQITGHNYDDELYLAFAQRLVDLSKHLDSDDVPSNAELFHHSVKALKKIKKRVPQKLFDECLTGRIYDLEINLVDIIDANAVFGSDVNSNLYLQNELVERVIMQQNVIKDYRTQGDSLSSEINRVFSDVIQAVHYVERFGSEDNKYGLRKFICAHAELLDFEDIVLSFDKSAESKACLSFVGDLLLESGLLPAARVCYTATGEVEKIACIDRLK